MDDDAAFWGMIEDAWRDGQRAGGARRGGWLGRLRGGGRAPADRAREATAESLKRSLKALPAKRIVAFKLWMEQHLDRAYKADLWEAAYVLMGGCSDDGFEYFRAWLLTQGRETFERVLRDPESLADLDLHEPGAECEFESLLYVPVEAYEELGFGDLYAALPCRETPLELDRELEDEERLAAKYPRIAARWG